MKLSALTMKSLAPIASDFILNNFIVETKGYFSKEDRRKHLAIKEKRPDLDIRFCFQNSRTKLSSQELISYAKWCESMGSNTATNLFPMIGMKSQYKNKIVCPECGKKNCAVFDDGHHHCFTMDCGYTYYPNKKKNK